MKSRIFTSLSAIAVLTALLSPISVAQDATTPAKKAQPDRTAPPLGMKAAMASEDTSKQLPSCAASVSALNQSGADDLIADNRLSANQWVFCSEPTCGPHVAECSRCSQGGTRCGLFTISELCVDLSIHKLCHRCAPFRARNGDDVQSGTPSKP